MSLGFVGVHAPFYHQWFQMVDALINHFGRNMKNLNPFAKPCKPKTEVGEVNTNEEAPQKDTRMTKIVEENEYGWKSQCKHVNKRNVNGSATVMPTRGKNNYMHNMLDDDEEEDEEERKEHEDGEDDNRKGTRQKMEKSE